MHADPREAIDFLEQNPDVEAIHIVITDANGVGRGKSIARDELLPLYRSGRNVAGSILGLDVTGEDVEETGLVWSAGDADKVCWPVAGTLARAPWQSRPTAQLLMTMHEADGTPAIADPRHVLARVIARLRADGYHPVVAAELEFYLVERDGAGIVPARGLLSGTRPVRTDSYALDKLDEMAPLFDDVYAAARAQGLPARTLMSEYAPGQFEVTLEHRSDALRAADEAILWKRVVRGVAARHGRAATFMAKPFAQQAGSGFHIHVSLAGPEGQNLFASDDPAGTPLLRQAIGGLRAAAAESMAVFAPNANSYRRFRRLSYAPVAPTWGINNRSVGFRIPAGPPPSRHVEHRLGGADANPYLAIAAVLAAMHLGIRERLDPGPPVLGNGYEQTAVGELPTHWFAALDRLADSGVIDEAFGSDFVKVFMALKRSECERFFAQPTELDYTWYLSQA
ncbi:MAG: glutamine synthetase [Steroidobacteraceae bacterium]|nr:glutamine synthetase [Steroidobacteraceae bacterium]MCC7199821.1 glutamine synthetase [Gammaproteobacteria bacterium]